eukprot:TRINITY_DN14931_c0_g1_i4.p3 TRINITY_DN14931_c0_g1~~TRINITY_DN14931_c0_g1_i4.p3  ORF type:complete len:108 (+),score=48.47 TRINITY_DN14931_c0_g1_i4:338-661(+)
MPSSHFIRGASFSESDEDEEEESEEDEESDEEEAGLLQGAASTPTSAKPTSAGPLKLHDDPNIEPPEFQLSLIHISEPTRLLSISYAVFCLKKKKKKTIKKTTQTYK